MHKILIFLKLRLIELIGLSVIILAVALAAGNWTYSPEDPTYIYNNSETVLNNIFGIYGAKISDFFLQSFGLTSFLFSIMFFAWGVRLVAKKEINLTWRILFWIIYTPASCLYLFLYYQNSFWLVDNGNAGFIGEIIFKLLQNYALIESIPYFKPALLLFVIVTFLLASNINLIYFIKKLFALLFNKSNKFDNEIVPEQPSSSNEIITSQEDIKEQSSFSFLAKEKTNPKVSTSKKFLLPNIDLLEKVAAKKSVKDTNLPNEDFMEKILKDFGVEGQVKKINQGPVVNLYEFEPAAGVKVSKIVNLSEDIARNTSSTSARVAMIPGQNTIGIEIPNSNRENVFIREILENERFKKRDIKIPIALGKSIAGTPIVADLTNMPHLLIAGTTGSGKSVCINTLIISILYSLKPDICKFILIDPKMLELTAYEGIPHLLTPVITDAKKATSALAWTVKEMNSRYKLMSKVGVRNIDGYNAKHDLKMPYIIVIVDEMSDLMLVAGKEIENYIQKLSQMARAAGIHIIMATQRPSVDVITGTIKANFPTRISFQVTSKIDSRTILGEQGAEQLLGKGDMLYMSSANRIVRIHAPFVSDSEIEKINNSIRSQAEPDYVDEILNFADEKEIGDSQNQGEKDELYEQALDIIRSEGKASTSFLQRKLQIGYNRAARIIDMMEADGVVSKANHVGKRDVL